MSSDRSYGSPGAFRRALTDKLREKTKTSRWTLPQLQRQMAYDRLLERLYLVDESWVVKGATALLARDLGVRATVDIDVYRAAARDTAEAELRRAAETDIRDWFRFRVGPGQPVSGVAGGVRLPVTAYVGTTQWCAFHVDVVGSETRITGQPDVVPPLAHISMPDLKQHGYLVYPLVDHIADKVAAILQTYGAARTPSTRYKDLIDLVAIVTQASVEAEHQITALLSEVDRRAIALPASLAVPGRSLWERGYAAEARRSLLPTAHHLDEALAVMGPFLDPLLDQTAVGTWDPQSGRWVP